VRTTTCGLPACDQKVACDAALGVQPKFRAQYHAALADMNRASASS
jgi:hypothetical protein